MTARGTPDYELVEPAGNEGTVVGEPSTTTAQRDRTTDDTAL